MSMTVAIPLHGSARWVDNVVANVRALPSAVHEILISDQTLLDDAASSLATLLHDDERVRVLASPSGMDFARHYQYLLETAQGDYFMWMPHDDIFDPDWVPRLVAALERHEGAWLAFGKFVAVSEDGMQVLWTYPQELKFGLLSKETCIEELLKRVFYVPFRGVFRRQAVLNANFRFHIEDSLISIDTEWVFTLALHGGVVYDGGVCTKKRLYVGSTHTTPLWKTQQRGTEGQSAIKLLRRYGPGGIYGFYLRSYVYGFQYYHQNYQPFVKRTKKRIKRRLRMVFGLDSAKAG
jgi:glycosyltransferase involved in cell wall biosynthesis